MRPLDRLPSIKVKLGAVIVATVFGTVVVLALGHKAGLSLPLRSALAALIALGLVQVLARGMTSPLREMASAASAMARGDYDRSVHATSRDEVGELARAFNAMAAELKDVDRMRRDLVANVSHSCAPRSARCRRCSRTSRTASSRPIRPPCAPRSPRPSGSAGSSPSCSTSPGSRAAGWSSSRSRSASASCSSRRRASASWATGRCG